MLARIFECDLRVVHRLAEDGIVVRIARGKYALFESITNYIKHLRERAAGRSDGQFSAMKANAEFKISQKRLNDLKIAALEGGLISLPELEDAWTALVLKDRQLFMSAASRIRFDLPHLTGEDQARIEDTLRGMLEEASIAGPPKIPAAASKVEDDA